MNRSSRLKRWTFGSVLIALLAASGMARANDITGYSVQKGTLYEQTSGAAPQTLTSNPFVFRADIKGDIFSVDEATLQLPSGSSQAFSLNSTFDALVVTGAAATLSALNSSFGNGNYTFTVDTANDGPGTMSLSLPAPVFPIVPHISNFTAAQAINADSDFTLSWDPFTGATGADHYELDLVDSSGFALFSDSGIGTSAVIPGDTLSEGDSLTGHLRFVTQTQSDGNSDPGALGTAGFYSETQFTLTASSSSGGGGNTPSLLASSPADGATDIATSSSVAFIFNEPMAATHSIEWSANVNTALFSYTWVGNGQSLFCTYSGGFPGGATITWKLNPTPGSADSFRDLAGNLLPTTQGSFSTTGSSPTDPCQGTNNPAPGTGSFSLFKLVNYLQTNNAPPVIDPESTTILSATFSSPTNFTTTAVSLSTPGGVKSLTNFFGNFYFFNETFATAAELDSGYPAGNYTITASTSAGNQTAILPLSAASAVSVPQVLNLEEFTSADVSKDFVLRFGSFAGAGPNDSISIEISDGNDQIFFLPDPCRDLNLPNTATSVVIPGGTFKTNQNYTGTLQFNHLTATNSAIVNTHGVAGVGASTRFQLTGAGNGGGTAPTPPTWLLPVKNLDGTLDLTLQGEVGRSYIVDSAAALNAWQPFSTNTAVNGSITIHVSPASAAGFFRARAQF